jgi:hypothetical protein
VLHCRKYPLQGQATPSVYPHRAHTLNNTSHSTIRTSTINAMGPLWIMPYSTRTGTGGLELSASMAQLRYAASICPSPRRGRHHLQAVLLAAHTPRYITATPWQHPVYRSVNATSLTTDVWGTTELKVMSPPLATTYNIRWRLTDNRILTAAATAPTLAAPLVVSVPLLNLTRFCTVQFRILSVENTPLRAV